MGRSRLLPRYLMVVVVAAWPIAFIVSQILERTPGGVSWLQAHPISTNLISSFISFCTTTLVVGIVLARISDRTARRPYEDAISVGIARNLAAIEREWSMLHRSEQASIEKPTYFMSRPVLVNNLHVTPDAVREAAQRIPDLLGRRMALIGHVESARSLHDSYVLPYVQAYLIPEHRLDPKIIELMNADLTDDNLGGDSLKNYYLTLAHIIAGFKTR